jgi:anti-sigma factor RsiW
MSLPCDQISTELVAYLDYQLVAADRRPVADHVATCRSCQQEIERLTKVQGWVARLTPIAPSPSFDGDFWRRVAAEPTPIASRRGGGRRLGWALPTLAAAAVLALALRSLLATPPSPEAPAAPSTRVAAAPPAPPAKPAAPALAAKPGVVPEKPAAEPAAELAAVDSLRPEDLPPELLAQPELFLRLPVVRRLETLEYLGSVDDRPSGAGGAG